MQGEYFFLPLEHVMFGAGSIGKLPQEIERLQGQRAFLFTTNSLITRTEVVKSIEQALGDLHVGTFSAIHQHTPAGDVQRAAEAAHQAQADVLVSVGGGSVIDATKAVVRNLAQSHPDQLYLPHIAIPTTLSAAEFSHSAGITNEELHLKRGFVDFKVAPRSVILDPAVTLQTPTELWLSSGIRALDHAVETLYAPGYNPVNEALALEAIRKLFEFLPKNQAAPDDLETRLELQLAAWLSYFSPINTPMGLSHNIGRRLGASYNITHGITSCLTLPHVMRTLVPQHTKALARIGEALQLNVAGAGNEREAALGYAAADAVADLIQRLNLPHHLKDLSIKESDLPQLTAAVIEAGANPSLAAELVKEMW